MKEFIKKHAKAYMILSICLLIGVIGATYAYYAASVSNDTNVVGTAGGGAAPTMTIQKISTDATGNLIPIDMDVTTLTAASKGHTTTGNKVCVDKNGYSSCQIYSVTVTNNSNTAQSYYIDMTELYGAETPNVDAVTMSGVDSVTNANSLIKDANGNTLEAGSAERRICTTESVAATDTSEPCYFMVLIKNLNEPQTDNGTFNGTVTAVSTTGSQTKADFGTGSTEETPVQSPLQLGDYVSYTPVKTLYETDPDMTGYSDVQTINPSELKLWRVLNKNPDGSVEIISEYVSSTDVYFSGQTGYLNFVGYLNTLAKQYETEGITSGSRHFGYDGQTEYLDPSKVEFTNPPPFTSSTSDNSNESLGGGDTLYLEDYNKVKSVLGTLEAYKAGTTATAYYWMASRYFYYSDSSVFTWNGCYVLNAELWAFDRLYRYDGYAVSNFKHLRPIVTLKSGLEYTGMGTSGSSWQILS